MVAYLHTIAPRPAAGYTPPMTILVLVPPGMTAGLAPECELVPCKSVAELVRALGGEFAAAVLVSDGLAGQELAAAAEAVRQCGRPVIEVRSERWDGTTRSPLSAACRGVISGFGPAGLGTAVSLAREICP